MTQRMAWAMVVLLGVLTTIIAQIVVAAFPAADQAASDLSSYGGPVFAFEVAKSNADLLAIFGAADDPERAARIAAMDAGNYWDFAFMAVYALFMASFFWAAKIVTGRMVWLLGVIVGLLAGVMDLWENLILLDITKDLEGEHHFGLLAIPVWTKFLSIMVCGLGTAVFLWTRRPHIFKAISVIVAAGSLTILAAFVDPASNGHFIRFGAAGYWILTLICAGVFVWRPQLAQKP